MKKDKISKLLLGLMAFLSFTASCDDNETYAELREREHDQINSFLKTGAKVGDEDKGDILLDIPGNIKVISEKTFYENDSTTDVSKNEYVLFNGNGVYMQIVRKGTGKPLQEDESARVITRFTEFNIAYDSISLSNIAELEPDVMTCQKKYGTLTASFVPNISGRTGIMSRMYHTNAVPSGWIVPLNFINLSSEDSDEKALVRLIVPSTQGQNDAQYNVYPCFYEISYQRGR